MPPCGVWSYRDRETRMPVGMPKDVYMLLAAQIRRRRERAKLSIEKLAELAGIGAGFLANIETNKKKPSLATLAKIAEGLHLPIAALFDDQIAPRTDADLSLALQLAAMLREKSGDQKKAIVSTVRSMAKGFKE